MKNTAKVYVVFFVLIVAITCNSCTYKSNALLKKIQNTSQDGDIITLSDYTNFEWSDVTLCSASTSPEDYKAIFNSNIPFYMAYSFDVSETLVFKNKGRVIAIISNELNPINGINIFFEHFTKDYIEVKKEDAQFYVSSVGAYTYLKLVGYND